MPEFQNIAGAKTFAETVANGPFSFQVHGVQWTTFKHCDLFNDLAWVTTLAENIVIGSANDFLYSNVGIGAWVN